MIKPPLFLSVLHTPHGLSAETYPPTALPPSGAAVICFSFSP